VAITTDQVTAQLTGFFEAIANQVAGSVADTALPLVGKLTDLPDLPGGGTVADPFGLLKSQILAAIAGVPTGAADVAQAIAQAITTRPIAAASIRSSTSQITRA
jgi:hypothetical protein